MIKAMGKDGRMDTKMELKICVMILTMTIVTIVVKNESNISWVMQKGMRQDLTMAFLIVT